MWEWVFSHLLGGHISLGKGFDDIAIEPETRNNPTHNVATQTPCFELNFFILTTFAFIDFFLKIDLSASSLQCHCTWVEVEPGPPSPLDGS